MKSAQWLAVLLLAALVGGVTFVMVYLGGSRDNTPEKQALTLASLTFSAKKYPPDGGQVPTIEVKQVGHHDFWFSNDSGRDVTLGLNSKSCKCTEVEVSIVSERRRPYLLAETIALMLDAHRGDWQTCRWRWRPTNAVERPPRYTTRT